MNESTLIYDIEIEKPIKVEGEKEWPGIEYASSFQDYANMGIACIGVFDLMEQRFRVFDRHTLSEMKKLVRERDQVVGWNNHRFDDPLLAHHGLFVEKSIDLMELFPKKVALEKAAAANGINLRKSMPGKEVPIRWQQGRYASVIDYCIGDVHITLSLYKKFRRMGYLIDPISGWKVREFKPFT